MTRFINPFTDMGFKRIFGQEISKDLLIDFLNDLLEGERTIVELQFMDKEQVPDSVERRGIIYDVYCTTDTGEKIIVEMQNKRQESFKERALYYLSNAIVRQGEKGTKWKYEIKAVYGVFLMNFKLETVCEQVRRDIILINRQTGELFIDKMRFIFLELPSFGKEEEACENNFERWIYVLKNMEVLKRMPFKAQKSVFTKLEEIADLTQLSREDRMKYDKALKVYRDDYAVMECAKKEGRDEGITEGMEKGMKTKATSIAKAMKSDGVDIERISLYTGLSNDEIEKL